MVVFYHLVTFAMQENIAQRYAIKFCVKLNKSATKTFASLTEAYGDATLSRTTVFKSHKALKEGRENVEDDPRSGRPISSTNDQNVEVVRAVIPHPPYCPDLALCDFYLFSKLKLKLKGHHFGTMENIQKVVTDELHTLTENDFRYCYDQWKKRNHCVTSQRSYFEGDNF